jgi:hypothetical protein
MMHILRTRLEYRSAPPELLRTFAKSASFAFCLAFTLALLFVTPAAAQEQNRAGLVVVHGDGSVATRCVAFSEASISGADLLARSGFDLAVEASSMGATVCSIDGEGCSFPQQSCFCACEGSPCIYWSYWRLAGDTWRYSNVGAGGSSVSDGEIDGWRWGLGSVEKAEAPPVISFEEICAADRSSSEATLPPTKLSSTVIASAPARAAETQQPATESSGRQPVEAAATEEAPTPMTAFVILFGVVVALPLLGLLYIGLRRIGKRRRV